MKTNQKPIRKSNRLTLVLALAAVAALGSGCGQQAYNEAGTAGGTTGTPSTGTTGTGTTSGITGTTTPNPIATSTTTNSSPNYSFHFETTGQGNATQVGSTGAMRVTADSVLQVSVTAGNGMQLGTTGYTVGFNCEQFNITVGSLTETALVKKANYTDWMLEYGWMSYDPCEYASTTWSYDFSPALSVGRSESLAITINGMQTDNCHANGYPDDGGCGMTSVTLSNYSVDGFISVVAD